MNISEVIERLRLIADEHGDLEVSTPDWHHGGTESVTVVTPFRLLDGTTQAVISSDEGFN